MRKMKIDQLTKKGAKIITKSKDRIHLHQVQIKRAIEVKVDKK